MDNNNQLMEFQQSGIAQRQQTAGMNMMASREAQEVQVAMIVAQQFPRDVIGAENRILTECQRKSLAEKAIYEFPRGGTTVTGPSIHLARAMARCWGNLDAGFKVLSSTPTESEVMAYCWDLETNYREVKMFTVPHIRQTKKGQTVLTDPRDIYEMIANQAARRERSCILAVIPGDIVDEAVKACNTTIQNGEKLPIQDRVRILLKEFQERYGVTPEMVEDFIGMKKEAFSNQSVLRLKNVYNSIKDNAASPEDYFDFSLAAPKSAEKEDKPDSKEKKGEKTAATAETPAPTEEAPIPAGAVLNKETGELTFGDL